MPWLLVALVTVIPAQQRFGQRITIALDVSGSLYAHRADALNAALEVLSLTATDGTEVRLATFGAEPRVSPVFRHPVDPNAARTWLLNNTPPGNTVTQLAPLLATAFAWGDVVVVSDLLLDDGARCARKEGRTLAVVLVGREGRGSLATARRLANGGVYRRSAPGD